MIGIASAEEMAYPEDTVKPMDSGVFQTSSESRAILAKGCILTSAQKAKLDAFQKKIRPGNPLYVTNMNKTNLSNGYMVCFSYNQWLNLQLLLLNVHCSDYFVAKSVQNC